MLRRGIFACLAVMWICLLATGYAAKNEDASEKPLRATLPNGLSVVVVRNSLAPVVSTVVNYRVGSNEAPDGFPGTAHALEHIMFRGSPGLSADQLAAITAAMGGMFDADTQQMVTQYFFTVPSEDLEVALHVEALRMSGILATDELWTQERGAIEQEVAQDLSNPDYVFYSKLLAAMFQGTPYAHDALGTRPSFDKTPAKMLKKFHDTWYVPNNATLVIVGDVEPQRALAQVKQFFGQIPKKEIPKRPTVRLQPVRSKTLNLTTDLPNGMAVASFRFPGSDSPDFAAAQVLADVLSSQRGSLYALVPQGKALSAGFSVNMWPQVGLGFATASFPKGGDGAALLKEVTEVLEGEVKGGVSADLVKAAKQREITEAELQKNSVSGLAMAWSQAVAVEGRQSPEDDVTAIQQVSVADVNRVARQYLRSEGMVTAILAPQASGAPVSAETFGGKESFAPTPNRPVKLPAWGKKALQRLSVPRSAVDPVVNTLTNGLKVIVQPEFVSDTVSVYGHVKNNPDLEAPKGQEGVDEILDQLFSFGTQSLDRIPFQKALDDIGADESAGTSFSLQVLPAHFERGVELLADNELRPALPESAFEVIQKQLSAAVAGRLQSPDYIMGRTLSTSLLPADDPSLREARPETVSSLTIKDVRNYYQHVIRPDLTTIVVIGRISPSEAKKVIEKYFGDWKANGPPPNTVLSPIPPNKPATLAVPDASRVQDQVTLASTVGLTRSNEDYYALELGNHVLGGAFYATRLYRDLRESTGLVYFVSSSFDVGKRRAFYRVDYACDPPNVSKVRSIVKRELKQMQSKPVSPAELHQAKSLVLREIPLSESSVESIASGFLYRATQDLPLDEPTLAAHRYLKLTAKQIKDAFAKWLRPEDLVQVSQGPSPQ